MRTRRSGLSESRATSLLCQNEPTVVGRQDRGGRKSIHPKSIFFTRRATRSHSAAICKENGTPGRCPPDSVPCPPSRSQPNAGHLPFTSCRLSAHTTSPLPFPGATVIHSPSASYLPGTVLGHRGSVANHPRHLEDREEVEGGPSGESRTGKMEN